MWPPLIQSKRYRELVQHSLSEEDPISEYVTLFDHEERTRLTFRLVKVGIDKTDEFIKSHDFLLWRKKRKIKTVYFVWKEWELFSEE